MSNARVIRITVIILALGIAGSAITLTLDKNPIAINWPAFRDCLVNWATKQTADAINAADPFALKLVRNGATVRTKSDSIP